MKWFFGKRNEDTKNNSEQQSVSSELGQNHEHQEEETQEVAFCVDSLGTSISDDINEFAQATIDLSLLRAQLADCYRRAQREPMNPETCMTWLKELDEDSLKRLALIVSAISRDDDNSWVLGQLCEGTTEQHIESLFIDFAKKHDLLTMQIIMQSSLRREEFVRHFIKASGAEVLNEDAKESEARLNSLDYRRLLAEADKAKNSAEERMAYLKKLQDEQEQQLGRRGKW